MYIVQRYTFIYMSVLMFVYVLLNGGPTFGNGDL